MKKKSTDSAAAQRPGIWEYRDARGFLADLCAWKQASERNFSFRKIARFADLGSPGYVQTYLDGKRNLKPDTAARIGAAVGLDDEEIEFFGILVQFTQAEETEARAAFFEQLVQRSLARGTGRLEAARLAYYTEWFIPVVHTMASLDGFLPDPDWIADRTSPRVNPRDARRALDVLQDLGMLEIRNGHAIVTERVVAPDPELDSFLLREYQRSMIRLGERALDLLDRSERSINGFTVTVPASELDTVRAWAEETMSSLFYRILALQEGTRPVGEVVQCNLQVFALTRQDASR